MGSQHQDAKGEHWEQMGAASGLLATVLFVIAFIIFLSTDPAGTPSLPNIDNAQLAPDYLSLHVNPIRLEILFNILGLGLFLWFLGTLLPRLRAAEGDPARGSTVASSSGGSRCRLPTCSARARPKRASCRRSTRRRRFLSRSEGLRSRSSSSASER